MQYIQDLVIPKTSGTGIKIDKDAPTFGWRDITADINVKGGLNTPTWTTFLTNISAYQFDLVNDECWLNFHIPHDYVPGTDLYIHAHWGLNTADTTNSITWGFDATLAERNDTSPDAFPATTNKTVTHNCATVNVPQYGHVVSEVQLTTSGALNGNNVAVDGIILCRVYLSADAGNIDPFLFFVDLHYQSQNMATKNKAPNFYA